MNDQDLLDVAATWSFWDRPPPASIERTVELPKSLSRRTALVFVNFEDPRLAGSLHFDTLERLTCLFGALRPETKPFTVFFDEIQWVEGWERWSCSATSASEPGPDAHPSNRRRHHGTDLARPRCLLRDIPPRRRGRDRDDGQLSRRHHVA